LKKIEELLLEGHSNIQVDGEDISLEEVAPDIALADFRELKIQFSDLLIPTTEKDDESLGAGGFAIVKIATYKDMQVAVKIIKEETYGSRQEAFKEFRHEVSIHANLEHITIPKIHGICLTPNFCLVLEYIPHGSLDKFIVKDKYQIIPYNLIIKILEDIAKGLKYMHSLKPPIAHLDLKPANVMLHNLDPKSEVCAKIIDFGTSRQCTTLLKDFNNVDNPRWLAPERIGRHPYNEAVDTFAYGIICWEFMARERPWNNIEFSVDIEAKVLAGEREPIPDHTPLVLKDIIVNCWAQDQLTRPNFTWVLDMLEKLKQGDIDLYEEMAKQVIVKKMEEDERKKKEDEIKKELEKLHEMKWENLLEAVEDKAKEERSQFHSSLSGIELDKSRNIGIPVSRSDKVILKKRTSQRRRLNSSTKKKTLSEKDRHFTIL